MEEWRERDRDMSIDLSASIESRRLTSGSNQLSGRFGYWFAVFAPTVGRLSPHLKRVVSLLSQTRHYCFVLFLVYDYCREVLVVGVGVVFDFVDDYMIVDGVFGSVPGQDQFVALH